MKIGNKKLDAAVHYICARCEDSSKLVATKLNKTLFAADLAHYMGTGKTLTGAKYKKLQHGPVPAEIVTSVFQLEEAGKLMTRKVDFHGYDKTEYISLREPDLSDLEKDEIDLLSIMMDHICDNHTATSISEATHDLVWKAAAMNEEIPLGAYLVAKAGSIEERDMGWADQVIANA